MIKHEQILKEIKPIKNGFVEWLEANYRTMDKTEVYNKIDSYNISVGAKMHLAHSVGRAMLKRGYD